MADESTPLFRSRWRLVMRLVMRLVADAYWPV
jgi:hypothetical protein